MSCNAEASLVKQPLEALKSSKDVLNWSSAKNEVSVSSHCITLNTSIVVITLGKTQVSQ